MCGFNPVGEAPTTQEDINSASPDWREPERLTRGSDYNIKIEAGSFIMYDHVVGTGVPADVTIIPNSVYAARGGKFHELIWDDNFFNHRRVRDFNYEISDKWHAGVVEKVIDNLIPIFLLKEGTGEGRLWDAEGGYLDHLFQLANKQLLRQETKNKGWRLIHTCGGQSELMYPKGEFVGYTETPAAGGTHWNLVFTDITIKLK
jgi:hypothetical protein